MTLTVTHETRQQAHLTQESTTVQRLRYGHFVPGGEEQADERLDAYLTPPTPITTVAHSPQNAETPENSGVLKYRYRDSKPASEE